MTKFNHFILILIFCQVPKMLLSQNIFSEQQAMSYLDQNYYSLEPVEGIYNVDVSFSLPGLSCQRCNYTEYTSQNYDKVFIYKSDGIIYHYSLTKGKSTGVFVSKNNAKYSFAQRYSFKIEGINDGLRLSDVSLDEVSIYDNEFEILMTGELKKIMNYFGYSISRNLSIRCEVDRPLLDEMICYTYDVSFKYKRIFPTKDYTPQPQYECGTGFVVSNRGEILTNFHVLKDFYYSKYSGSSNPELKVYVQNSSSQLTEYKASIITVDSTSDLAIICIAEPTFRGFGKLPYRIKSGGNLGQNVFTLGYPFQDVMGNNIKLSSGMITGTTGIRDNDLSYTLDLNLNPGNSGGPLFNNSGDVIGIVSARLSDEALGMKVENVSYAIKSERYLSRFDKSNLTEIPSTLKNLSLEQKIQKIKPFIVIVKARGKY